MKHSRVQFALEREIDSRSFERLSIELLGREAFNGIVPGSGHNDKGRDAEILYWVGSREPEVQVIFQFSLESQWERKLNKDSLKIASNCSTVTTFVFVTNRTVTVEKRHKLETEHKNKFRWNLVVYDGEWLRYQLEAVHLDLTLKYLGIQLDDTPPYCEAQIDLQGLEGGNAKRIFAKVPAETVRASLIAKSTSQPDNVRTFTRLADVEYHLRHYKGSLRAVNAALRLKADDWNLILRKAATLAEWGIQRKSRAMLFEAKEIFLGVVAKLGRSVDHYNLGNVLGALGERSDAEDQYRKALAIKSNNPRIWKNLGSLLFHRGDHVEELRCYEMALALDPNLVEAYLSMATTQLVALNDPDKALESFRKAFEIDPNLDRKWPYARFWHSEALARLHRLKESLREVETGLAVFPDDQYLLRQKGKLLMFLWPEDPSYKEPALKFFDRMATVVKCDYISLFQIIQIRLCEGTADEGWPIVESSFDIAPYTLRDLAKVLSFTWADLALAFQHSRAYARHRKLTPIEGHLADIHAKGLSPNSDLPRQLSIALMLPFGVMAEKMRKLTKPVQDSSLNVLFEECLLTICRVMSYFGPSWMAPAKLTDYQDLLMRLAILVSVLPDRIAVEAGSQFGYCLGAFKHEGYDQPNSTVREWTQIRSDIADWVLDAVQREWRVFAEN